MREFRNLMAHCTLTEIDDELVFEDRFRMIENAVDALFYRLPDRRRHWRNILLQIRKEEIFRIEPLQKDLEEDIGSVTEDGDYAGSMGSDSNVTIHKSININIFVREGDVASVGERRGSPKMMHLLIVIVM